jgi:raffinose/stachyose/melibiose transport system permease protein
MKTSNKKSWILPLFMLPISLITLVPFYYIVVNTLKTPQEVAMKPMALPETFNFDNYRYVFENVPIFQSFLNTLFITSVSVFFIVMIGAMAAYPLVFNPNKFNKIIMFYLLAGFLIPFQTTLIPLFELMTNLHLVDKLYGLILLYLSGSVFAFFITLGYMKTIPKELIEAATIDGCSIFGIFWRIITPLLKPITITVTVFQTMWIWNDFLAPMLFLNSSDKSTLVLEIYKAKGQFAVNWPLFMTLTVIVLIPMLIFFIFMQKHIVKGLVSGAVKG